MAMKETERDAPGSSAALASPAFMLQGVVPLPTPLRLIKGRRCKGKLAEMEAVVGVLRSCIRTEVAT